MPLPNSIEFSNRSLRSLIVPLVVEQLLNITVGLADSLMVARVGEAAVSAVSLVDAVNVLLVQAFAALATGGAVVAGQYLGRRQTERACCAAQQLFLFMGELSLAVTVLLYALKPFILHVVFGAIAPDVAGYADTYFVITEASTFFLALYSAGAALFRVMGNARISMEVSLVMNAVNVTGNGILIFGFHRGVGGVAVPTLISRIVAAAAMTVLLRRRDLTVHLETPFRFHHDRMMIRNILRIGVPNGVEGSMFQLGKILLLSVATVFGTASVAANAIGNTVCNFQCLAPSSIGLGMVTVVSRCVGAGDYEKARFYTRKLVKWGYVSMALANLLTSVLLPVILLAYGLSDTADAYARVIVWSHAAMGTFLWPLAFELPQALRAAGDTRFTMTVSTISMWTCRVVLGVVFARTLGFGVLGIWYSMYLDWVVRDVFFVLRYRGRRWETMALRD